MTDQHDHDRPIRHTTYYWDYEIGKVACRVYEGEEEVRDSIVDIESLNVHQARQALRELELHIDYIIGPPWVCSVCGNDHRWVDKFGNGDCAKCLSSTMKANQ